MTVRQGMWLLSVSLLYLGACAQPPKPQPVREARSAQAKPRTGSSSALGKLAPGGAAEPTATPPPPQPGAGTPVPPPDHDLQPVDSQHAPKTAPQQRTYVVRAGDTLSSIARHFYGDARQWRRIYQANVARLKDPHDLKPGMKLVIP